MSKSKPPYKYDRCGHWWYVWKMEYFENAEHGEKASGDLTFEEARKETYRLNGWTYTEPKTKK